MGLAQGFRHPIAPAGCGDELDGGGEVNLVAGGNKNGFHVFLGSDDRSNLRVVVSEVLDISFFRAHGDGALISGVLVHPMEGRLNHSPRWEASPKPLGWAMPCPSKIITSGFTFTFVKASIRTGPSRKLKRPGR